MAMLKLISGLKEDVAFNYCYIFEGKLCKNGECHPTASSYECTCNPGYVPSRSKKQCISKTLIRVYITKNHNSWHFIQ